MVREGGAAGPVWSGIVQELTALHNVCLNQLWGEDPHLGKVGMRIRIQKYLGKAHCEIHLDPGFEIGAGTYRYVGTYLQ